MATQPQYDHVTGAKFAAGWIGYGVAVITAYAAIAWLIYKAYSKH